MRVLFLRNDRSVSEYMLLFFKYLEEGSLELRPPWPFDSSDSRLDMIIRKFKKKI
jgi:hypothetical protein